MPCSIVYSHTCNATALNNISTRVTTPINERHLTRRCGLLLSARAYPCHVSNEMRLSPSSTPSSASAQLVHISYTMCKMILTTIYPMQGIAWVLSMSVWNCNVCGCSELYRRLYRPSNHSMSSLSESQSQIKCIYQPRCKQRDNNAQCMQRKRWAPSGRHKHRYYAIAYTWIDSLSHRICIGVIFIDYCLRINALLFMQPRRLERESSTLVDQFSM